MQKKYKLLSSAALAIMCLISDSEAMQFPDRSTTNSRASHSHFPTVLQEPVTTEEKQKLFATFMQKFRDSDFATQLAEAFTNVFDSQSPAKRSFIRSAMALSEEEDHRLAAPLPSSTSAASSTIISSSSRPSMQIRTPQYPHQPPAVSLNPAMSSPMVSVIPSVDTVITLYAHETNPVLPVLFAIDPTGVILHRFNDGLVPTSTYQEITSRLNEEYKTYKQYDTAMTEFELQYVQNYFQCLRQPNLKESINRYQTAFNQQPQKNRQYIRWLETLTNRIRTIRMSDHQKYQPVAEYIYIPAGFTGRLENITTAPDVVQRPLTLSESRTRSMQNINSAIDHDAPTPLRSSRPSLSLHQLTQLSLSAHPKAIVSTSRNLSSGLSLSARPKTAASTSSDFRRTGHLTSAAPKAKPKTSSSSSNMVTLDEYIKSLLMEKK